MFSLLIETCTEQGIIAIAQEWDVFYQTNLPSGWQHSRYLIPSIQTGLKECNIGINDLIYVAVGIGPGSYTGIRVGVAAAKALAFALKIPLVGVCTLQGFNPIQEGKFVIALDAKISGIYCLKGTKSKDELLYDAVPFVCEIGQVIHQLADVETFVTPHHEIIYKRIAEPGIDFSWNWIQASIDARLMCSQAEKNYNAGKGVLDGHLDLLYLRK